MRPRIAILADDLIWSSRLVAAAERAGVEAVRLGGAEALGTALETEPRPVGLVVDLGGRRYDGVGAVGAAAAAGVPVLAVGQHDDAELRKRALAAGAWRVLSYNKLFRDGSAVIGRWLARP